MDQGEASNVFVTDREREYLSKVCWLLHDAGTFVLRATFNSIHPAISLKDHLAQTHIQSVLVKLHEQKAISEKQWKVLYPSKGGVSSQCYDSRILVIILQTICHLSPPYPNGWSSNPLPTDTSISADVVRLQILLQQIGSLSGVRHEEYPVLWRQIVEVLLRHGGTHVRVKIRRIDNEQLSPDQQHFYIQQVKDIWGTTKFGVGALKHLNGPRSLNKHKGSRSKKSAEEHEGLSLEDKVVLAKMYKLLVDNIVVDDIIDRLQQGQIIKITDRQEIIALSKNSERMQYVLAKIQSSKLPYALKLLLDSLKFKYPKIYEEVTEFRRITYKHGVKETRDMVGLCHAALKANYNNVFSKCCPLPWNDNFRMPIRDYYTQVDIVNSDGDKVHLNEILPPRTTSGIGKKVVLEGEAGSGKSTLATMVAYQWAAKPAFYTEYYRFLILVDVDVITDNVRNSIYVQTMTNTSKVTCDEFWETLEANAEDVVLVIDGFAGGYSDLNKLINGTVLRQSAVITFVNPNISMSKILKPDYKLFNVGLNVSHVPRCLRIYASMVHIGSEDFDTLMEDIESWSLISQMCHPFICMAIIIAFKYAKLSIKETRNATKLFESYITALATQFCKRQHFTLVDGGFPEEVGDLVQHLQHICFTMMTSKKTSFNDGELMGETININIMKFGIFQRSATTGQVKGHCSVLNSIMTARYLIALPFDDMDDVLQETSILKYTKYSDVVSFLCGLCTHGYHKQILASIYAELVPAKKRQKPAFVEEIKVADLDEGAFTTAHLVNFNQCLQGLIELPAETPMIQHVAEAFPKAISLHKRGLYTINCLRGFINVLRSNLSKLVQFEMTMNPYYLMQSDIYHDLASALSDCETLKIIKTSWTRMEIMGKFLATATQNRNKLDLVHVDAHGRSSSEEISAVAWDNLQTFCENLEKTKKFVFKRCTIAPITGHVIKCLPRTISNLDFSHSCLNLICATELASHLEHSSSLKFLNLSGTHLEGSSVVALSHGLKLSGSIVELRLCGTTFNRSGVWALGQALRLVTTLETLDIDGCRLTTDMCSALATALFDNHSVKTLVLSSAHIPPEGRSALNAPNLSVIVTDSNNNGYAV